MNESPPEAISRITPIVLAAGDSSRMGFPKALLPIGDDTFLTRILSTLRGLGMTGTTIVLGNQADRILPRISHWQVRILLNRNPAEGQLSSVKLALSGLEPSLEGCMLWPVDQPGISKSLVSALIRLFFDSSALLALPVCGGKRGHPAVFGRTLFQEILDTPLHEGLKGLVSRHMGDAVLLPTDEAATIEDIDTPEDYLRFAGKTLQSALLKG